MTLVMPHVAEEAMQDDLAEMRDRQESLEGNRSSGGVQQDN